MENLLELDPVWKVRSNHSLEHATLHVLSTKVSSTRVSGLSDAGGFWLLGHLPTDLVLESAQEALNCLQNGEKGLAIHEHCGSNMVPSIIVAGGLAWLAMAGTDDDLRKKTRRLPLAVLLALFGYEAAKPVGPVLQEKATSTDHFDKMIVREVLVYKPYNLIIHRVIIEFKAG